MPTKHFATYIWLPPGSPSTPRVRELFERVFNEYRWFKPVRYGVAFLDGRLDPHSIDFDALVAFYEERKTITVLARTDRDFFILHPARTHAFPFVGHILWKTSLSETKASSWRSEHSRQVAEIMRLFGSPFAYAGTAEDCERKAERLVPNPDGFGQTQTFTVRDPSEGLAGLFWRNFYGPPFARLFGERLSTLPSDTRQNLGDDLVLVQPYELPSQAGTPEADARERELISHLGPECFYDHARHIKPTRLPVLPPAP